MENKFLFLNFSIINYFLLYFKLGENMKVVSLDAVSKSYKIFIESGIISSLSQKLIDAKLKNKKIGIVSNSTIWNIYGEELMKNFNDNSNVVIKLVEDGEEFKIISTYIDIINTFIEKGLTRDSVVIGFGGGVIGDMAGFVAGTLYRGVKFIQIPTTLLSFVDSSVGGKTGVNHKFGKNLIGVFNQPEFVLIDPNFLYTLEDVDVLNGIGEILKHGFISKNTELHKIIRENDIRELIKDKNAEILENLIYENVSVKASVVMEDERESGVRKLLNYGHTFGHVVEGLTNYTGVSHGIGVLIGMLMASKYAYQKGYLSEDNKLKHDKIINLYTENLKYDIKFTRESFDKILFHDKKVVNMKIVLILLKDLGEAFYSIEDDEELIFNVFQEIVSTFL